MSAQHPNIFERLSHRLHRRHEPQPTPWQRFREEHDAQSVQPPQHTGTIMVNPTRIKAMARMMRSPQVHFVSFNTWLLNRTGGIPQLPPPRETGAMHVLPPAPRHSDTLLTLPPTQHDPALHLSPAEKQEVISQFGTQPAKPAPVQEDRMPGWGTPDWINSVQNIASFAEWQEPARADLFADVRQPSSPLEDDDNAPTVEHERTIRNRNFQQAITGLLGKDEIA